MIGFAQNTITGKIVGQANEPIEYAEVILHTLDSIAIKSELTNEEGVFTFKDIARGTYKLNIQYFSQNIFSKIIKLEGSLDLETIITDAGLNLSEVVITGKKPLIERKVDRLVFNVENSVAATGGNGLDALKLTPRIKVQNDEISMIGKGSVAVLINDRIVPMSGTDLATYLKSLNAEDIKSIEVISNPPAKYSAEGNSGLVNIVFKKSKNDAWNASLRSIYQQG